MTWKPHDVCLLDKKERVKVLKIIRNGREAMIVYHKQWRGVHPLDIVNVSRLSILPPNHQP